MESNLNIHVTYNKMKKRIIFKSCLLLFLVQKNRGIDDYLDYITDKKMGARVMYVYQEDEGKIINCHFKQRIEMCHNVTYKEIPLVQKTINRYSIENDLKIAKFFNSIIFMPFVSLIGFFLNLLTIMIIKSKKNEKIFYDKKTSNSRLYDYIVLNSVFNMIECFLNVFNLMSYCFGLNSIYCSSIDNNIYVIYFKIYFIEYFGEIMKTCSHLTSLAFSIERFIETKQFDN